MALIHWTEQEKIEAVVVVETEILMRGLGYKAIKVVEVPTKSGKNYFNAVCVVADNPHHHRWNEVTRVAEGQNIPVMIGTTMYKTGMNITTEVVN